MATTFYLWKVGPETGHQPRRVGAVEVDGTAIRVRESQDPELAEIMAEIATYPALPLRTEERQEGPQGPQFALIERTVTPAEQDYVYAVSQVACKVGGFEASFKPDYP